MHLVPGATVIHPHHGPATVVARRERTVAGRAVDYVDLEVHETGMQVCVPMDRIEEIGLRDVASGADLDRLAEVLSGPSEPLEKQWSRRIKAQRDALVSGNPLRLAALVRDLLRRSTHCTLGLAERDILRDASGPLLAEVALAVGCDEEQAREITHALVLEQSTDVLTRSTLPTAV